MRALRADDPHELGGHRLLARLGAGGMGVVFLARTTDGTLVALKVIRSEHAADPAFRARFRREVRLASGLSGRWVVPVTAADAEAREPWLATEFVPGPALAEAVGGYGALPPYAVAALGVRLAEALAEVHAAGLVHRDVKPGNVLLALDGPRLIDFGIAHDSGATALTEPDAVVGTPGYLAPEQIRTGGRAGPASDVFALGCVLAYAATGRRPFGTGNAPAVLYRTVHEDPDLTGLDRLPTGLRAAITTCLAKDPDERPTAAELAGSLAAQGGSPDGSADGPAHGPAGGPARGSADGPAGDRAPDGPRDPRVPADRPADAPTRELRPGADRSPADGAGDPRPREAHTAEGGARDPHPRGDRPPAAGRPRDPRLPADAEPPGRAPGTGEPADPYDWLPSPVLRLVAERSARALDPPPRQAARAEAAPPAVAEAVTTTAVGRPRSRRRFLVVGGSAAAALAASGAGAAVLFATGDGSSGGGAPRRLPTHAIGLHAALTGSRKADGKAQERGARLAVAHHNAREDARFRLSLIPQDDRGEAGRARDAARRLLGERSVRAVIGPTTVDTVRVAVPLYGRESMPAVLVSVDNEAAGLTTVDVSSLCATRLSGSYHVHPLIDWLTRVRRVERTAVVEDRAAGDVTRGVVQILREAPPGQGEIGFHPVAATEGFGPAVADALATRPEAIVYAGASPERAAACAKELAGAGFDGPRTSFEPVMRPAFLRAAGDAAEGWVLGAPYTQAQSADTGAARAFTAAYRDRFGGPPPRWAAEAYDAVGLIAAALGDLGGGADIVPGQVAERIFKVGHAGVAKPLRFTQDLVHALQPEKASFLYEVREGEFRFLGRHDLVD